MWLVSYFRLPILCFSCFRTVLRGESNPSAEGFGYAMDYKANQMTQAQKDTVLYYIGTGEYDKASQYLADIERELNERANSGFQETMTQWAQEHPVQGALTNMFSWPLSIPATVENLGEAVRQKVTGEYAPADVNRDAYLGARIGTGTSQGVQEAARQAATDAFGNETAGDVAAFLAGTGLSIGQNITQLPLGALTLPAMAASASGTSTVEALDRGATPGQAAVLGLSEGLIEALTEKLPLENLYRLAGRTGKQGVAQAVRGILGQMGTEAAEETVSEIAGNLVDTAVMRDKSEYQSYIRQLMDGGMSQEQAEWKAFLQFYVKNTLQAAVGGALSGGVLGGGATAINAIANRNSAPAETTPSIRREDRGMLIPRLRTATESTTDTSPTQDTQRATMPQTASEGQNNTASTGKTVNENGLTALTELERTNLSSGKRNKIVSTLQDAVSFVRNALTNRQSSERAYLGKVPNTTAQKVLNDTGVDITGYNAILSSDNVRHIISRHGDPAREALMGQSAVTADDIALIPQVLSAPDNVTLSTEPDNRGRRALVFEKQIGDNYVTIQAVSDGTHSIQTDTLYKQKIKGPTDTGYNVNEIVDPVHNAQSVPPSGPSNSSIPQTAQNVNPGGILLPTADGDGMLPTADNPNLPVGETRSYDAAAQGAGQNNTASTGETGLLRMTMQDFTDVNSSVWNNVDYNDTETQTKIMRDTHQDMVDSGQVVRIPESTTERVSQSYPDLRTVKKSERTPILRQKMNELKASLRQFLNGLKGSSYEFEVNGNILEAKLYDTGVREVMEKVTQDKASMLYHSDEVFQNARYLYSTPDYDGDPNIYRWNYFYTPVQIGDQTVGVRIAVRDMVPSADGRMDSQIYNWGIKTGAALDGGGPGNIPNTTDISSATPDSATLGGGRPGVSAPSSGASSDALSENSIPPIVRDVNGRLQFGIMLPKAESADVAVGETRSYDAAEDTGPLPIRLPEEPLDSGKDMTYNNSGRAALAEDEYAALLDYKSSGSYKLNAAIRDGRLDPAQEQAVAAMDRALAAMPVYRGRVYRRMSFDLSGPETLAAFLAEHEAGSIIVYPAYTSTSTSPDGYPVNGNLTVTLVIDGHSGRNIDGFGNNFESEILFPRESSFYIERLETDDQGKPVIYMREVAENGEGIQPGGTGGAAGRDYRGQQGESPQERSQTVQQMQETVRNDMQDLSQWNPKEDFDRQRLSGLRAEGKRSRAVTPEDSTGAAPYGFDPYSNMLNEYGAIPEGENPARVVDVPVSTNGNDRVSRAARTVMEAEATPESMLGEVAEAITRGDLSHDVVTDKAATARARRTVENKGWEGALEEFHQAARSGRLSKNNVALGQVLLNNAMNAGDSQMAIDLLVDYASLATAAGQTLQAQRMLKKLTPEGQLYGIQRSVSNIQEELQQKYRDKAPDLEIPEELIEKFRNATDQDGRDAAAEEIYKNIASQVPSTWMDKWNAWRYMAMLTNPRTHIRNIVGNAGFVPVRMIKDAIATTLEAGADLILPGGIQRTKAPLNLLSKTDRDLVRASFSDVNNVQNQLLGSGKYADSASGKIEDYRTIFKFKPLEGVRKGNSNLMEVEDSWFSKTAYAGALAGYLKANGVTARQFSDGTVSQETLDVGREYAIQEAQKANAVCEKLSPGT